MTACLLLEIGFDGPREALSVATLKAVTRFTERKLENWRFRHEGVRVFSTPRRLALWVGNLADQQPDLDLEVLGPPLRVAFDTAGRPTPAATRFATKVGLPLALLRRVERPQGCFLAARKQAEGGDTRTLLPGFLSDLCSQEFWHLPGLPGQEPSALGASWLVALYGQKVVPFTLGSLQSGAVTRGHGSSGAPALTLGDAVDYEPELRAAGVLVEASDREHLLTERLQRQARERGNQVLLDAVSTAAAVARTEQPRVAERAFAERFLRLPRCLLLAVIRQQPGAFAVAAQDGELIAQTLWVTDAPGDPAIEAEHSALELKLCDAEQRYHVDRKRSLTQHAQSLAAFSFHPRLGSMADKLARLRLSLPQLGLLIDLPRARVDQALRCASLAKADLATATVADFPELRGHIGQAYALADGAHEAIAAAIGEHYAPRSIGDATPRTELAALLGLADRLDSLVGYWAVSAVPAGRVDPRGSRADSLAALRILIERGWAVKIDELIQVGIAALRGVEVDLAPIEIQHKLGGFLRHRLRGLLLEECPADAVNPCFDAAADCPVTFAGRVRAYAKLPAQARQSMAAAYGRLAEGCAPFRAEPSATPGQAQFTSRRGQAGMEENLAAVTAVLRTAKENDDYATAFATLGEFVPSLNQMLDRAKSAGSLSAAADPRLLTDLYWRSCEWIRFEGLARG